MRVAGAPVETRIGALYRRVLNDPLGREIGVYPLFFGRARLYRGPADCPIGFDAAWDYASREEAIAAAEEWDGHGQPPGDPNPQQTSRQEIS